MFINYKEVLQSNNYKFIKENKNLGKNIILLNLAGSISYGTNIDNSDIDVRGITIETKENIYGLNSFEQYEDKKTDTVIYGLKKYVALALKGNPNILELLGTKDEHILQINEYGKKLRNHIDIFLSKRVIYTYGNYATSQLRRIQNALARDQYGVEDKERHILNSIKNQMYHFNNCYKSFEKGSISLYIDQSLKDNISSEIFMDINLRQYPLRDFINIYSEMSNVIKDYSKLNKRNKKKDESKLYKHAMHLIRLLITGTEILNECVLNTYRAKERQFLLDIRNGKYSFKEIFQIIDEYEKKFIEATEKTMLPDKPDENKVEKLLIDLYSQYYR